MTIEKIKEIARIAWIGASNAHRLYPNNKHTFVEYWNGSESQFKDFIKSDDENFNEAKSYAEKMNKEHGHDVNSAFCGYRNCFKDLTKQQQGG